jgi:triacylglycerol lipase
LNVENPASSSRTEAAGPANSSRPAGETVVLLHGLGLGGWAMKRFETALKRDGYRVVNLSYPSRRVPLEQLADDWLPRVLRESGADDATRVHFVTHSMGGILLRLYLRDHAPAKLGRTVMLAPPNAGSEVVDRLMDFPPFNWVASVNGRRLGTAADSLPRSLGPWTHAGQLGIIAGDRSFNPLFSAWLPGPSDGKVAVSSARLAGMSDFLVLPHSHTWLQWRGDTLHQARTFLRTGRFDHPARPRL